MCRSQSRQYSERNRATAPSGRRATAVIWFEREVGAGSNAYHDLVSCRVRLPLGRVFVNATVGPKGSSCCFGPGR